MNQIINELKEMGFVGGQINALLRVIVDQETMESFRNFIILKGDRISGMQLVSRFLKYMLDNASYQSYEEFETAYNSCSSKSINEVHDVLSKLFMVNLSSVQLNKVLNIIDVLALHNLYQIVAEDRHLKFPDEIIYLIEKKVLRK